MEIVLEAAAILLIRMMLLLRLACASQVEMVDNNLHYTTLFLNNTDMCKNLCRLKETLILGFGCKNGS